MLDMRTAVVSHLASDAMMTIVAWMLWRQNRGIYKGLGLWVVAFSLQVAGLFLTLARDRVGPFLGIVSGNAMIVGGLYLLYVGLGRFASVVRRQLLNYVVLAVFLGFLSWFTLARPDISIRIIVISLTVAFMSGQAAWLMLRQVEEPLRPATHGLGLLLVGYSFVSLARIIVISVAPFSATGSWFAAPGGDTLAIVALQMLNVAVAFGLVLMVSRRVRLDEESQRRERERVEKALRESETRRSAVFRASPIGISLTRYPAGTIRDANPAFLELLGYSLREIEGRTTPELGIWVDLQERERVIESIGAAGSLRNVEVRFRKKVGEIVDVLVFSELLDINGERFLVTLAQDISQRKVLEREREQSIAELREALAQVKTLSGLVPICAGCKKVRDDEGYWHQVEEYMRRHSEVEFSHGLCPDCVERLYPDFAARPRGQAT
jgi:PAS domain S-box-containing protein